MLKKSLIVGYGVIAYMIFLGVFAYTIGFLADIVVPKGVDDGVSGPAWLAILVNAGLIGLFAVQHSVMARPWFNDGGRAAFPRPSSAAPMCWRPRSW